MKSYGLIGRRLLHSLSPEIHREFGNFKYELFQLEPDKLDEFFDKKDFAGLNVTFPYRQSVIKYCDRLTAAAEKIGFVDTITVDEDGMLTGDNCEYKGFCHLLKKSGIDVKDKKVIILGRANSMKTVLSVVKECGAKEIIVATKTGETNFENLYEHSDANIIINTTQTGMYPNNGERFIYLDRLPMLCGVIDLIYNPRRTRLICDAEDLGLPNCDGLSMLVSQAFETEIRFGRIEENEELMKQAYKTMSDRRKNIIFVGLRGCGKSTIAKVIAAKLSRPCIDVDRLVEIKAGMPVSSIFEAYGEKFYRELETEALKKITRNGGQVISTDSGCVLDKDNEYFLRQNGYIVHLFRPLEELKINGVPLLRNREMLKRVDSERTPSYRRIADINVRVTNNAESTVFEIMQKMNIKQNPKIL